MFCTIHFIYIQKYLYCIILKLVYSIIKCCQVVSSFLNSLSRLVLSSCSLVAALPVSCSELSNCLICLAMPWRSSQHCWQWRYSVECFVICPVRKCVVNNATNKFTRNSVTCQRLFAYLVLAHYKHTY